MFPGMSPDQIKQRLLGSVRAGTADAVISEIGEAAVFRADSPLYATATAFVKGRILEVHLDGTLRARRRTSDRAAEVGCRAAVIKWCGLRRTANRRASA